MARPREFDGDEVLDKAVEAFRSKGYEGTSVADLEKGTGLVRASLYGAFGDKHQLYLAALRRYDATRSLRLLAAMNGARTGRAAVERLFAAVIAECARDPRGCLMAGAASERAAHDAGVARCVEDNRRRMEGGIAAAVLRGRTDGSVRRKADDARGAARFLFAAVLGLRALAKAGAGKAELEGVAAEALRTLD
ncbi:MAG TPA: helix-turn-helix domain-containing protein [Elusimicrobiota bacterium]|nr:helix-turn-helix domain-containing protein [Elusimicrobiota bacterium]